MLKLTNLKSPKGATKNRKRLGRGPASGQGTQAGKGHKGQKARKSGNVRIGFEGNNKPLYSRIPKRGFRNAPFKIIYAAVNLATINDRFEAGKITKADLIKSGVLKGADRSKPVKILAKGKVEKAFTFEGFDAFSEAAKKAISEAGGKIIA